MDVHYSASADEFVPRTFAVTRGSPWRVTWRASVTLAWLGTPMRKPGDQIHAMDQGGGEQNAGRFRKVAGVGAMG